ncbi:DUF3800 domain-containing protein [Vibrio sp. 1733]|jgi:hypothetical protein|uniref:DUF3800 domain-containing protein n=1 Tax=Vibrio TaxID=662 RepID=UPI000E89E655|nr:DUF3800 domain-containing protein [Vibrio sp. 1733]MDW2188241.1 DUF3800 domain-containing protein [Vibrio sp. 1733]HBX40805.1 DUF3800 domain-containing protein [Marinobacter adhaerens]
MHICYLDEAGCTGALPSSNTQIQPVFVIGGLFIEESQIPSMTQDLLALKRRFFPNLLPAATLHHDWMKAEIKGADLRRKARSNGRNDRRFSYSVVTETLDIIQRHDGRIVSRIYAKPINDLFNGTSVYTYSVQSICSTFQNYLEEKESRGIVIADSRNKGKNASVSHSIFTQRFRAHGDPYPGLLEVPTFGHSDNHTGLQLIDLVCSSLLFPIAAEVCMSAHLTDRTHLSPHYLELRRRFGANLKSLQHRYQDDNGRWHGGVTLSDPINRFSATQLFRP